MTESRTAARAAPRWARRVLVAAAIYNLAWGVPVILFPQAIFRLAGAASPNYPAIWQCVGMMVGVFGVGYAIAARDPYRHWPIVLVGLLGKICGPIGFVFSATRGELPWIWGLTIFTNDLMWWAPFAAILYRAYSNEKARELERENPLARDESRRAGSAPGFATDTPAAPLSNSRK